MEEDYDDDDDDDDMYSVQTLNKLICILFFRLIFFILYYIFPVQMVVLDG